MWRGEGRGGGRGGGKRRSVVERRPKCVSNPYSTHQLWNTPSHTRANKAVHGGEHQYQDSTKREGRGAALTSKVKRRTRKKGVRIRRVRVRKSHKKLVFNRRKSMPKTKDILEVSPTKTMRRVRPLLPKYGQKKRTLLWNMRQRNPRTCFRLQSHNIGLVVTIASRSIYDALGIRQQGLS